MKKEYAGFWVRSFAGFLDITFLILPFLLVFYFVGDVKISSFENVNNWQSYSSVILETNGDNANLILQLLSVIYITYFLSSKRQATLGKIMLGIYVGRPDGSRLTPLRSVCRGFASLITSATLGLGFLLVIFTKEKTALHDLICDTRVFHGKKS